MSITLRKRTKLENPQKLLWGTGRCTKWVLNFNPSSTIRFYL